MTLVPIDEAFDKIIGKKAREIGGSKADVLRMILEKNMDRNRASGAASPDEMAAAFSKIPSSKPGSLADEIQDMAKSMFLMNMMKSMSSQSQAPQQNPMGDIQSIFLIKELTKPSIYELMMMEKIGKGEESPKWLEKLADEQKETRELLKQTLGLQKEDERMKQALAPIVEQMTASNTALAQNQQAILEYIAKGEGAAEGSLEAYIANALKTRLADEALDAIDRGLFNKQQVVTPEGGFDWKAVLDRMLGIGEELVKKMPRKAPPVQLVRTMDGNYMHPSTGQVFTPQQVAQIQARAQAQAQAQAPPTPGQMPAMPSQPPAQAPPPPTPTGPPPEQVEQARKKKTAAAIDTFMSKDEGVDRGEESEPAQEPTGEEQY